MSKDNFSWNRTLKFSWGHIIAFVALIFTSYVAYMGEFYSNGGNFTAAAIRIFIIDIVLLTTFIGAQISKGAERKFNRSIIIERILIFLCPIVFMCSMIPYNHYWNVYSERDRIEEMFSTSIEKSKMIFVDYSAYAEERIKNYRQHLSAVSDAIEKENCIHTLRLQLLSLNTDNLQALAMKWIESANQGASVWNAFLIGNIDNISNAIESWNNMLVQVSNFSMSNEPVSNRYPFDSQKYKQAIEDLKNLKEIYKNSAGLAFNTVWSSIMLFLMLMFPYFLQERNTRAIGLYYLIPHKASSSKAKAKAKTEGSYKRKTTKNYNETTEQTTSIDDNDIYDGTF